MSRSTPTSVPTSLDFWLSAARSNPQLQTLLTPRRTKYIPHQPTLKQSAFLLLSQKEALYGGSAGGGKSEALLMAALQHVDIPGYAALILRKTYADLALPGALMDRARHWLGGTDAVWRQTEKTWVFPAGATLSFGYLDRPDQRLRYQSSEFQFIGFDELTQFGEEEYRYLFSRLRRRAGVAVPLRMRAATNPGGPGHDWVRRRFIDPDRPPGRIFIPASIDDNPHLDRSAYLTSLGELDAKTRAQLLAGAWDSDDTDTLVSVDDLESCATDCLWSAKGPPRGHRPELYVGVDIGRSRDRTVIWTFEKLGDVCWCREVLVLADTEFRLQQRAIEDRLTSSVVMCAIDRGGIGCQLAEDLERKYPGVVEGATLTAGVQGRLAQRLAVGIATGKVRLPDDPVLFADFRQVRRPRTIGGQIKIETTRTNLGHADRFWAAALAFDAAHAWDRAPTGPVSLPRTARRG